MLRPLLSPVSGKIVLMYILSFFIACFFLMVIHPYLRIYLCTCIHIYLPEYLRTCLCTVVRRDMCWYGDTGVRWCVVTSLRLSVFTYFRTSVYPYRSICVHGQIFPFVCPCICA